MSTLISPEPSPPPDIEDTSTNITSPPTHTDSPSATPNTSTSTPKPPTRKRKRDNSFEEKLVEAITSINIYEDNECSHFGEEIARDVCTKNDQYKRAQLIRDLREVVFNARFPAPVPEV